MEDATFIATVGSVYVATVWSMGNPDLRSALKSRSHVEQREWDDHLMSLAHFYSSDFFISCY